MKGKETTHIKAFRDSKLKPGELVIGFLEGWIGEMMGSGDKAQYNGQFVLTNMRACFYRKGFFGEVFQTIPLSTITSVETLSRMGYRVLRFHTSHDELTFKTFESKELFDYVYDQLESARRPQTVVEAVVVPEIREERECPFCAELILQKAKVCKHCGRDVVDDHTPPELQPNVIGNPSAIDVVCGCGAHLKAKPHLAGKSVRCPKCKSPLQVPQL